MLLYKAKYEEFIRKEHKLNDKQPIYGKLIGLCAVIVVLFLIFVPMLIFSDLNPALQNLVQTV